MRRDFMEIHETSRKGLYTDFDLFEKIVNEVYKNNMEISSSQYPLLISEYSQHNKEQRQKVCEIMFEKFSVPAFFMCKSGVLSCFASGRSTALILDSGASQTVAVPIHDGYALQKGIIKSDLGGEYVTDKLLRHIEENMKVPIIPRHYLKVNVEGETKTAEIISHPNTHPSFDHYTKSEIARDIKENVCRILDPKGDNAAANTEKTEYELPDGKRIVVDDFRFSIGEVFFNPPDSELAKDIELNSVKGFHQMILESINKCDVDLRKELLSNIILTGGNTLFSGFVDVMQKKLVDIAPQNAKVKLIAYPHSVERRYSAWIGGSILSSLGSFQTMWIGKAEYDEYGSYIVEKKCP